jgi:GNAT superfamily N-acetyltransferase
MTTYFYSHYYPESFNYGGGLKPGADLPAPGQAWVTEITEAEAMADLARATPAGLGLRVERSGTAYLLQLPPLDHILFNRVIGLGLIEPASEAQLDQIIARYRAAGVRRLAVQVSPEAMPTPLPDWLMARGLLPQDAWIKLYRRPARGAEPARPTALRIEEIGREQAEAFASVTGAGYGMPASLQAWLAIGVGRLGWRHYLAYDGEEPVAGAALFAKAGVGWLGIDATLPSHRRQGAQSALLARRVADGAGLGCQWLASETEEEQGGQSNASLHNFLGAGFKPAYARRNYIGPL